MSRRPRFVRAVLLAVLIVLGLGGYGHASPPAATQVESVPAVGALFAPSVAGLLPALHGQHYCTASVVHSTGGDLVVTAAHCIAGTGAAIEFAPAFHDDVAPYGVWAVRRVYVDPMWRTSQDPDHDVAFLQMWPLHGRHIEQVTGARPLGTPVFAKRVTVVGYPMGSGRPITCDAALYDTSGYSSFDCAGYVGGTSGGPWIQDGAVVGVVGGYEQGGCVDSTSYSSPFDADVDALYQRAAAGGAGDLVPVGLLANAC